MVSVTQRVSKRLENARKQAQKDVQYYPSDSDSDEEELEGIGQPLNKAAFLQRILSPEDNSTGGANDDRSDSSTSRRSTRKSGPSSISLKNGKKRASSTSQNQKSSTTQPKSKRAKYEESSTGHGSVEDSRLDCRSPVARCTILTKLPIVPYRPTIIQTPTTVRAVSALTPKTEFEHARRLLHVKAVPDSLPCREDEFLEIQGYLENAIEEGTGSCICKLAWDNGRWFENFSRPNSYQALVYYLSYNQTYLEFQGLGRQQLYMRLSDRYKRNPLKG
jgi:hypothetical protein